MKKALVCIVLLALIAAGQFAVTLRFTAQPARIEVRGPWEGGTLSEADKARFQTLFPEAVFDEADGGLLCVDVPPDGSPFYAKEIGAAIRALQTAKGSAPEVGIYDYSHSHTLTWQFLRVTAFAAAVLVSLLAARYILGDAGRRIAHFRRESRYVNLGVYLSEHSVALLTALIVYAILISACLSLLILTSFQAYVPPQYLPDTSLFDLRFYWNLLRHWGGGPASGSAYSQAYSLALAVGATGTAVSLALMAMLYRQGSRFLKRRWHTDD